MLEEAVSGTRQSTLPARFAFTIFFFSIFFQGGVINSNFLKWANREKCPDFQDEFLLAKQGRGVEIDTKMKQERILLLLES